MRAYIDLIESQQEPPAIIDFLYRLATDEVGSETFGDLTVQFEGFSDMCWEDAEEQGKTSESLEDEMLADWARRHPDKRLITSGWTHGNDFWSDTMFWAIYRKNLTEALSPKSVACSHPPESRALYGAGYHYCGDCRAGLPQTDDPLGGPRYEHDCRSCVFIGRLGPDDCYSCMGPFGSYVRRYSDDGPDYTSAPKSSAEHSASFRCFPAMEQEALHGGQ